MVYGKVDQQRHTVDLDEKEIPGDWVWLIRSNVMKTSCFTMGDGRKRRGQSRKDASMGKVIDVKSPHVCAKSLQWCPTLCDHIHCSPPSSSVHGSLQVRTLQPVAMPSSRGIFPTQGSNPRLLCLLHCRRILYH